MNTSRQWLRYLIILLGGFGLTLLAFAAYGYATNHTATKAPDTTGKLTALDKARLAEAAHLRHTLGNRVWGGFGDALIPVVLWDENTVFLTGYPAFPQGWELVPNDLFENKPYYRKPYHGENNFTFRIGKTWTASMATKLETDRYIHRSFRRLIPGFLDPVFPYHLFDTSSEIQLTGVIQESFHAYQASTSPENFNRALHAAKNHDRYWQTCNTSQMLKLWLTETKKLVAALDAPDNQETRLHIREFFAIRGKRRTACPLDRTLQSYETSLEWLHGLAKYTAVKIWQTASVTPSYHPVPQMENDPAFEGYHAFGKFRQREINQITSAVGKDTDARFTNSGLLQAYLLDRLMPNWQMLVFRQGATLENLLRKAAEETPGG